MAKAKRRVSKSKRRGKKSRRAVRQAQPVITAEAMALAIERALSNVQVRPSGIDSVAIATAVKEGVASLGRSTVSLDSASLTMLQENMARQIDAMAQKTAPAGGGSPVAYVGCDQRHTKNIGNYESFVYGFSVSFPVPMAAEDDIETISTKEKLRPKYEAAANLISDIMKEVGAEIDKARGAA